MNILHIDTETGWRGGEQQAWWLIEGLAQRGVARPHVVARPESEFARRARETGWAVEAVPLRGAWDLLAAARIAALVRRHAIDIVHAHTAHAHNLAWLAVARHGAAPVVVTRRVDFSIAAPGPFGVFRRMKYIHPGIRMIAISQGVKAVLVRGGVPPERIVVVPSGIDPARWADGGDRAKIRALVEADDRTFVIGNIAALTDHKGQIVLVRAAARLRDRLAASPVPSENPNPEYEDFRIVIAGEGEERPTLEAEIARLGLERHVRLIGWRTDVADCLAAFDCFCMASHLEGLGTSILDALCTGLPVVATRAGGIPDVVADRETGLLVPPSDPEALAEALVAFMESTELRARLAAAGRRIVAERFTADRMVEGTLAVYRSILS